jgi:type IV pilus assembly protein PilV
MNKLPNRSPQPARRSQGGVMILEALVAILIFSLGIIALMGLQANSIAQVSQAKYRTDASYLANQVLGRMWLEPVANPLSNYQSAGYGGRAGWDALVASSLPNGQANIAVNGNVATVTITWRQPEDTNVRRFVAVENITRQ